jgi:hypothetical protein
MSCSSNESQSSPSNYFFEMALLLEKRPQKLFSHIVVDFDLKAAMRHGLVNSLVLDKRSEIGALPDEDLEFKAYRDENGNPRLSEGQRVMLRAGLTKLRKLERDFAAVDQDRHPKMLVVCEDTSVTPLIEDFLKLEGFGKEDVLRVDSNRKGELKQDEWKVLRERIFDMERGPSPRVIISVDVARRLRREQYLRHRAVARIERRHFARADHRARLAPYVARPRL